MEFSLWHTFAFTFWLGFCHIQHPVGQKLIKNHNLIMLKLWYIRAVLQSLFLCFTLDFGHKNMRPKKQVTCKSWYQSFWFIWKRLKTKTYMRVPIDLVGCSKTVKWELKQTSLRAGGLALVSKFLIGFFLSISTWAHASIQRTLLCTRHKLQITCYIAHGTSAYM